EQDLALAIFDVTATGGRLLQPPGDTGRFPRFQDINQVMPDTLPFFRPWFGRPYVQAPVKGHRIQGYDLSSQALGQFDPQVGLARAGRPGQDQGMVERVGSHLPYFRRWVGRPGESSTDFPPFAFALAEAGRNPWAC